MTPSSSVSPINKADLFDAYPATQSSIAEDLNPQGISQQTIVIIASVLAAAFTLTIVLRAIHCVRRRRRRQADKKRYQHDIKKSLQRARRPVLTIDTDLPRANEFTRSAGAVASSGLLIRGDVPHVPLPQTRTAHPTFYSSGTDALGLVRA